jgi:hypothetical protein
VGHPLKMAQQDYVEIVIKAKPRTRSACLAVRAA